MNVVHEPTPSGFVGLATSTVRMMPIHKRVVETEVHAFRTCRLNIFRDEIAPRSLFRCTVICQLCVEEAKPFMVLRRHDHVLHSGRFSEFCPSSRCVWL